MVFSCSRYGLWKIYKFPPDKLRSEGYKLLSNADTLIGHNIIGFDIPMVEKFGGVDLSKIPVIDTLVLSRLFNPTREGGHSLRLGDTNLTIKRLSLMIILVILKKC